MTLPRRPTLRDVARAAKLSVSGAAYALRGHPRIPAATIARVRALAEKIGYRPDARVATLMAHVRRSRLPDKRETLAFVWVSTYPGEKFPPYHEHYLRTILAGATSRAQALGCVLAEFWLDAPGMTSARLAGILRSRGITGVVFSPAMHDLAIKLDWPWDTFACAIIGNTDWSPGLHRAGHHHYRSMWLALQRLRGEGFRRPATVLSPTIHDRIHGVHAAAFQINHPSPELARQLIQFALPEDCRGLERWSQRIAPDALIAGWPVDAPTARSLRRVAPTARCVVTLDWQPGGALAGIDVGNEHIAASAVDLVVGQLHRHERGVPTNPATLLLDGVWRDAP
jgi:LacI family transcriptional regulator